MNKESQNTDVFLNSDEKKPSIINKTRVVILQHPQEKKEALATVPLLLNSLSKCQIFIGLSWSNLKKILKEEIDYKKWAVIYLGTQAESNEIIKRQEEVVLVGGQKKLTDIEGIVVLDGSWREVKTLWWRNAWLLKLNRIVLNPKKVSIYSKLRREPRKNSLSTLEAVGLSLSAIEADSSINDRLLDLLKDLIKRKI